MSNHQHTVLYDPYGQHPNYRRDLHSALTRSINQLRGTRGPQWTPDDQSPVVLLGIDTILHHSAYSIANPDRHDLETWEDWPGVLSKIEQLAGPPEIITKPEWFYDPDGDLPDTATFRFVKPPQIWDWSDDEYRAEVRRRVEDICDRAQAARRGRPMLGRVAILAQSTLDTPKRELPSRTLNPRVACKNQKLRIAYLVLAVVVSQRASGCARCLRGRRLGRRVSARDVLACAAIWRELFERWAAGDGQIGLNYSSTGSAGPGCGSACRGRYVK
ncbi:MAG: hypothetical protein AAF581_15635 [Planctomycetota bacterium]